MLSEETHIILEEYKKDILELMMILENISKEKKNIFEESDKNFFIFILKHILFFKELYNYDKTNYFFRIIISDFYYYIMALINNELRYVYLNERSIIENYTRCILKVSLESDHITNKLFDKLKIEYNISNSDFSILKQEYLHSCEYIHGGKRLETSLISYFNEYLLKKNKIKKQSKYYSRVIKIIKIFDKILIKSNPEFVNGVFHRRKTLLKYLIGKDKVEILKNL